MSLNTSQQYSESFLEILKKNNDLELLPQIIQQLKKTAGFTEQGSIIEITSNSELDETNKNYLEQKLAEILKRQIMTVYKIEPNILGGLMIKIGDRLIDNSLRKRIDDLKNLIQRSL